MQDKAFKAAPNRGAWYGFNLLQGHIFGIFEGVQYVSNAAPGPCPGTIYVYKCTRTPNYYRWAQTAISSASELGRQIIAAQAQNPYGGARPMPIKCNSLVWPPKYPTYSAKRQGHFAPRPKEPQRPFTWVDQLIHEHQNRAARNEKELSLSIYAPI